jgi:hypothetical protein
MTLKRFNELTKNEIRSLTREDLETYIDLECAINKIPLLPKNPPVPPSESCYRKLEENIYGVGDFYFKNEKDANDLIEFLDKRQAFDYNYEYDLRIYKKLDVKSNDYKLQLKIKSAISKENFDKIKNQLKLENKNKEQYKKSLQNYEDIEKARENTENDIVYKWELEQKNIIKLKEISSNFDRYLKLADNDKETALRFLKDAYKGEQGILEEFLKNRNNNEAMK